MNYVPNSDSIILKPRDWPRGNRYPIAARQRNGSGRFDIEVNINTEPPAEPPAVEGDNYSFVDVDAPSEDLRFSLRDKAGGVLDYLLYVWGGAGNEQLELSPGFNYPPATTFPFSTPGYEFSDDGYFRLMNRQTGAHYHNFAAFDGMEDLGIRMASNITTLYINPGVNYKFVTSPTTSFYVMDMNSGLWVKPWIVLDSSGIPMMQFDAT